MEKNFIREIELDYQQSQSDLNLKYKRFIYFNAIKVLINTVENNSFIIKHYIDKNNQRTQYLYCRDGLRAYFSDVDVLLMLLQIEDVGKQEKILNALLKWLRKETGIGYIEYKGIQYSFRSVHWCDNGLVFHTHKDIDVMEEDIIALINLIIAKDAAVTDIGNTGYDFAVRTVKKYLVLLRWYWYKDKNVENQLKSIGYRTADNLISNFCPELKSEWKEMDLKFQEIKVD